jgi:hypothetical protein
VKETKTRREKRDKKKKQEGNRRRRGERIIKTYNPSRDYL